jgi:hypothetical protein
MAGRPLLFKTPEILEGMIQSYFDSCFEDKWEEKEDRDELGELMGKVMVKTRVQVKPISITGLAIALDTSRETLLNYQAKEQFFDTIKKAKDFIENYVEDGMLSGKINVAAGIFNLINNWEAWSNRTESHSKVDITSFLSEEDKSKLDKLIPVKEPEAISEKIEEIPLKEKRDLGKEAVQDIVQPESQTDITANIKTRSFNQ